MPREVIECDAVKRLVADGAIVIAAGGGGPPVYRNEQACWEGLDAVVDKDRTAAVLATSIGADVLLILTDVDAVYRDWGTERARAIGRLSVTEAEELLDGDALGVGSMRPKVEAGVAFVRSGGSRAVIAQLEQGLSAIAGRAGTTITGEQA